MCIRDRYHGEVHNKPNDVHNTPEKSTGHTDGSAVLPTHARRRMQALRDGNLRPPLYYTQQEQTPCAVSYTHLDVYKRQVPFSDWYDTKTGRYVAFIARSVQGGIFALML